MEKRGKLFVIEGTDASGKETQTNRIVARLQNEKIPLVSFSFPMYETPTGNILKRYLGKWPYDQEFGPSNEVNPKLASILYAEDRYFAAPEIRSALEEGKQVFCNRYVESNMGHQGGKISDALVRKDFFYWLQELEYGNFNLPRPDLVIFLYMPHEVASQLREKRGGIADGHEGNPDHLLNAENAYLELAEMFNWTRINCAPNKNMASLKSIDAVAEEVYYQVKKII